ncbi:MAG TPA: ATP-binding protein [Acidimicrobiales bacterium]|nr:ATP-binding protein [Acidimicrobiales bacterium]
MNASQNLRIKESRLAPGLESVVAARRIIVAAVDAWKLSERVGEDAALVVSELASNAVLHARTTFTVSVCRLGPGLRVEVSDGNPVFPEAGAGRPEELLAVRSMTGRGLQLVAAISDRWGAERRADGKVVWAEVGTSRLRVEPSPPPAFPPAPAPPRVSAVAVAAGVKEVTVATGAGRQVHLIGVPVSLLIESTRQLTDLQREMQVIGLDQSGPRELVSLASSTREIEACIGYLREAGLADAKQAVARGESVVDYDLVVPHDAAVHLDRLGQLLARARSRLARRYLLTLPASEDVVAFRLWWRDEVLSQLGGRPPVPCPIQPDAGRARQPREPL